MNDQSLPNDVAARSPTGEILDQATKTPTEQKIEESRKPSEAQASESKGSEEPKKEEAKKEESILNDKGEKKDEEKKEEKAAGAPEKYEDFKLPEGFTLDEKAKEEATTLFKDLGLSQDNAQKLVDFHVKATQEAFDAPFTLWQQTQDNWKNEIKNDPQLGPRLPEVKASFSKMLDGLEDPNLASAFREAMDYTGAGNNPAFVRVMDRLAKRFTEGGHVSGAKPSVAGQTAPGRVAGPGAHALYPNNP